MVRALAAGPSAANAADETPALTEREREVVRLIADANVMRKLDVHHRARAYAAGRLGLLGDD